MVDCHTLSAPSSGRGNKQWPKIKMKHDRKLAVDNWALQAINNKRKFELKKSIDFANPPWVKGLKSVCLHSAFSHEYLPFVFAEVQQQKYVVLV